MTLRTVDSTGMDAAGTVNVFPAAGAALRNSLNPFPGKILIDGFIVKSPDSRGIDLGSVTGLIAIGRVTSDANAHEGLAVDSPQNAVKAAVVAHSKRRQAE